MTALVPISAPAPAPIDVSASPHPFKAASLVLQVNPGSTIADILSLLQPDAILREHSTVTIDGMLIPESLYGRIKPKPGTHVYVQVVPRGGGGNKDPLRILAFIAVIAASFVIPALLPSTVANTVLLGSGATALTVGKLVQAGVLIGGGLLVNALIPVPKPRTNPEESPTLSIAGARNQLRLYSSVPRVLGKHLVVPPYAAQPYTSIAGTDGIDQYVTMLFVWSLGPIALEDERIGETPLSEFDDWEKEFRRGYLPSQLLDRGAWAASGGTYPNDGGFGNYYTVSAAGTVDGVSYAVGDTIVRNHTSDSTISTAWDKNGNKPVTLYDKTVNETPLSVELKNADGWVTRNSRPKADILSLDFVWPKGLARIRKDDAVRTELVVALSIRYRKVGASTWITAPPVVEAAERTQPVRQNVQIDVSSDPGEYEVSVRRTTADRDDDDYTIDDTYWAVLRTIINQYPINLDGLALTALRIKASETLRGSIDNYNAVAQSILLDYVGGSTQPWPTAVTSLAGSDQDTVSAALDVSPAGSSWQLRLRAVNVAGAGPWSEASVTLPIR